MCIYMILSYYYKTVEMIWWQRSLSTSFNFMFSYFFSSLLQRVIRWVYLAKKSKFLKKLWSQSGSTLASTLPMFTVQNLTFIEPHNLKNLQYTNTHNYNSWMKCTNFSFISFERIYDLCNNLIYSNWLPWTMLVLHLHIEVTYFEWFKLTEETLTESKLKKKLLKVKWNFGITFTLTAQTKW